MSEKVTKKTTTAEATKKNAEAFEKALQSTKAEYTKRETKAMFNIYGNIASVTAKSARVFLKAEAFKAFEAYAEENTKNAEAKSKEAKNEAQKKSADKAKQNAEAFNDSVKSASKDRKGPHAVAITVTAEAFKATAEAFKAYDTKRKEAKKSEAEAQKKNEAKKSEEKKSAEADSTKKNEEAKSAAK